MKTAYIYQLYDGVLVTARRVVLMQALLRNVLGEWMKMNEAYEYDHRGLVFASHPVRDPPPVLLFEAEFPPRDRYEHVFHAFP